MDWSYLIAMGKVTKIPVSSDLVEKEQNESEIDLAEAKKELESEGYKWAIVKAYYSMFHLARALLYNKNYREKSHHCLIIALNAIYVETNELSLLFLEGLKKGKNLRENADYYDEWSLAGANEMISLAEGFLGAVKKILKK